MLLFYLNAEIFSDKNNILKKNWRTPVLFVGPLFWTSGTVCPGFQSQGVSFAHVLHSLHAMDSSDSHLVLMTVSVNGTLDVDIC